MHPIILGQQNSSEQVEELNRQLTFVRHKQDRLLNLRLLDENKVMIEGTDRDRAEQDEIVEKAFELSQTLEVKWVDGDYGAKRQILEIVCSNLSLDGVTLCYTIKTPFGDPVCSGEWMSRDPLLAIERLERINQEASALNIAPEFPEDVGIQDAA
ncbi:hypothetical protein OT109_05435 [Phycisphaeraceae bacterium D3-23]